MGAGNYIFLAIYLFKVLLSVSIKIWGMLVDVLFIPLQFNPGFSVVDAVTRLCPSYGMSISCFVGLHGCKWLCFLCCKSPWVLILKCVVCSWMGCLCPCDSIWVCVPQEYGRLWVSPCPAIGLHRHRWFHFVTVNPLESGRLFFFIWCNRVEDFFFFFFAEFGTCEF